MRVIVKDVCGSQTLHYSDVTLELGMPVRYRWECPLCLTVRFGDVSDVTAGKLAGHGAPVVVPLSEGEIDDWVESARRVHFLAGVL